LCSITGVSRTTAEVMIAEMGTDMTRFPTAGHLCAWAGVAPATHESAGKRRPVGTMKGSTWLQRALIESARAAARTKGSLFSIYPRESVVLIWGQVRRLTDPLIDQPDIHSEVCPLDMSKRFRLRWFDPDPKLFPEFTGKRMRRELILSDMTSRPCLSHRSGYQSRCGER
jgi:hypothetical protein